MRWADWTLIACAVGLVVVGPAMAFQEFVRLQDERATRLIVGEIPPPETGFRLAWRLPLAVLGLVAGLAGAFTVVRALIDPVVRGVSARLVGLLVAGLVLLGATYWIDGAFFSTAPYALRGRTIVWLYPVAGILLAGSAWRLAQLQDRFGRAGRAAEFEI